MALRVRKSVLVALSNISAFTNFRFLDLVKLDFLDLAGFATVNRFLRCLSILLLLAFPGISWFFVFLVV